MNEPKKKIRGIIKQTSKRIPFKTQKPVTHEGTSIGLIRLATLHKGYSQWIIFPPDKDP